MLKLLTTQMHDYYYIEDQETMVARLLLCTCGGEYDPIWGEIDLKDLPKEAFNNLNNFELLQLMNQEAPYAKALQAYNQNKNT